MKERLNRLADEVGKRLDIHQVEQRPSIGKFDAASAAIEPIARDSLFSTSQRKAPVSPLTIETPLNPLSAAAMRTPAYPTFAPPTYPTENPWADAESATRGRDIDIQSVARAAMERPQFVLDNSGDGDYDEDEDGAGEILDQVDTFLAQSSDRAVSSLSEGEQGEFLLSFW